MRLPLPAKHPRGGPARHRLLPAILAVIALAFVAVALVARRQPVSTIPRLVLAVGSTFIPVVAVIALILAVLSRRVLLSIIAGIAAPRRPDARRTVGGPRPTPRPRAGQCPHHVPRLRPAEHRRGLAQRHGPAPRRS